MALGELTGYQKQNAYYKGVQLGENLGKQTEIINNSTRDLIATQMASTSAIIASQERINEGIDAVSYGLERVEQGMYGLQAAFEWGISEVVWQIEQNREVLKSILEVLSAPLDTQAKELRRRAEEAYANGWIDDGLEDFLQSEKKNRYDFTIHISLGMIYLFHKIHKEKALEYFEKAIKYAKPKSPYHASYALLHKALIKRDFGLIDEAETVAAEAAQLSPDFGEALFQHAHYNALLSRAERAIPSLRKAINIDINYCEKAHNGRSFDNIRDSVNGLFAELRHEEKAKFNEQFAVVKGRQDSLFGTIRELKKMNVHVNLSEQLTRYYERIVSLSARNSFRDYLEANMAIGQLQDKQKQQLSTIKDSVRKEIAAVEGEARACRSKYENDISIYATRQHLTGWQIILALFIPTIVFNLFIDQSLFRGPDEGAMRFFSVIPILGWGVMAILDAISGDSNPLIANLGIGIIVGVGFLAVCWCSSKLIAARGKSSATKAMNNSSEIRMYTEKVDGLKSFLKGLQ